MDKRHVAPLSKVQNGLYVECVAHQGEPCYNIPYLYTFDGSLNAERLCRAVESAVAVHPTLFTRIELTDDGEPQQTINNAETFTLKVEMVADIKAEAAQFVKPFNIIGDRLFRIRLLRDKEHIYLLQDIHHIISDGASRRVLLADIEKAYQGGSLLPEERSLADVATEEAALAGTTTYETDKKWYEEQFDCGDLYSPLLSDMVASSEHHSGDGLLRLTMDIDAARVETFCKEHGIFKSSFFTSVYAFLLAKFNNEPQALFATIHNGRTDRRLARSVAMLVKTVPVYQKFTDDTTVVDFLRTGQEQMTGCRQHEAYAYSDAIHDLGLQIATMFAWHGTLFDSLEFSGKEMGAIRLNNNSLEVPFYVKAYSREGHYEVEAEYAGADYSEALVQQFLTSYEAVVRGFLEETLLRDVSIVNEEQMRLLDSFNQNDVEYDDSQTLVSLFRQQARTVPDNIAVVFGDKRFTYAEVDEMSDRIAGCIASKGLGEGDVVSVLIPRCEWMAIASLGVLKSGCAYQPLDPSYPKERLNFMMQDASAKLLIADEELRDMVDEYTGDVVLTKDLTQCAKVEQLPAEPTPESLLILLYTSGSTGVPKGCRLTHANLVAFCHWYHRFYGLKPEHNVAAYASYGFDACMMDMYPALTCGATVHIIPEDIRLDLIALNEYFENEHVTHSFMTTQLGYQFATSIKNHSLLHLSTGGEKLATLTPPTGYNFYNVYGPTECTIFTTAFPMDKKLKDIPIGKPLDNMRLYIVDKEFNRLPVGAAGELWVSGPQVSHGYLNRPEKTAEVYINNPFTDDKKYARVYRTGDIVRYLPDGNIQFVGRKDGQVKIRGFRIELKEVEAVIREFPGIKDATVQAFDYENGGKFIAAYIVSNEQINIKDLHAFIGQQKPSYMIPAATMQIESIPLNQNQKVNRKALPQPVVQVADHEYVAPANDIEKLFCEIFGNILTMDKVSADDNFFDLGGTSLMVTRVIIMADKAGHHIAYGDLFSNPTPQQLATFLSGDANSQVQKGGALDDDYDYTPIDRLLMSNTLEKFQQGERLPMGNALVTGATGFLGIHILKELIDRDDVPVIWCLVRGENEARAEQRMKYLFYFYFSRNYEELFGNRLRIIPGDVTQEILVDGKVDVVFNCAAMVKHFSKSTEIEDVNIGGAVNCVRFCLATGARLIHVSTYSSAGLSVNGFPGKDAILTEQKLFYGQFMDNQYILSKFISERVVLEAIALHGLVGKVMRVGNLAPRRSDGEFQINFQTNSAMGRIRVFKMLGCYPYEMSEQPLEFSPIDQVARSIVLLSQTPRDNVMFHPFNNHHVYFADVLRQLCVIDAEPKQVETPEFNQAMDAAKNDPEKAKLLSSLLAYQDMAHGQKSFKIPTSNSFTAQVLYRLGFFWDTTSWDYVEKFIKALDGFGYFDAKLP